ncbi:MAG: DUF3524 domain-containing protein [Deltaproteobacteria bacterium]|nr:DUF3524 domain-containing protein [Deltaproteobacteria bacterium]
MRVLYLEPFDGGSHAAFGRTLMSALPWQWTAITQPPHHWKWHMRQAAVDAALRLEGLGATFDLVFASSYVPLAELVGLVPQLAGVPRVLYFHENQLDFPTRTLALDRDLHYGVTQLVSAMAASVCVFNSQHNRDSFLGAARALLARMPDGPRGAWVDRIAARSEVLPVPLELPDVAPPVVAVDRDRGPLLLWNHRWEHDKDPDAFIGALRWLDAQGLAFRVAICGQRFTEVPECLRDAPSWLGDRLVQHGAVASRDDYLALLGRTDVVVSTAVHEFFGVAVLEAIHCGAQPVVPDRLSYVELIPPRYRVADEAALRDRLASLCRHYAAGETLRADRRDVTRALLADAVMPRYRALCERLVAR